MSSVLVKGMKIPESCKKCIMRDGLFCMASDYKRISYGAMHRREEWCPLVALPNKHGDLIDSGKLLRDIEKFHLSDGKFQHWVEVQNTIVEAEDSE